MENKLITTPQKNKLKLLSLLLIIALCVTMLPLASFAGSSTDVSGKVEITGVTIKKNDVDYIVNDEIVGDGSLRESDRVDIRVEFIIDETNVKLIESNNYFKVKMPSIFQFTNYFDSMELKVKIDGRDEVVGTYSFGKESDGDYMKVVFTKDLNVYEAIDKGFLEVYGSVAKNGDQEHEVAIGDFEWTIPTTDVPDDPRFHYPDGNSKNLFKNGWDQANGRTIWSIFANQKKLYDFLETGTYTSVSNVVLIDDLAAGSKLDGNIQFSYPMPMIDTEGKITEHRLIDFTDGNVEENIIEVTRIDQNPGEMYADFKARITNPANAPCYGAYNDERIIISLGDMPSSKLVGNWTWSQAQGVIDQHVEKFQKTYQLDSATKQLIKEKTLEKIKTLYGTNPSGDAKAQVRSLKIDFATLYTGNEQYIKNEVSMFYDNVPSGTETTTDIKVNKINAGAEARTIPKGQALVIKSDSTSKDFLQGVEFTLQEKNEVSGEYEDVMKGSDPYTVETDDKGEALFTDLVYGDYRLVETGTLDGYVTDQITITDIDGNPLTSMEFTVSSSDTEGIIFNASNDRVLGEVELEKVDSEATDSPISGASFILQEKDGSDWKDYGTEEVTGADGKVKLTDLPWGDYRIVETKAAPGYEEDSIVFLTGNANGEFTVGAEDQSFKFTASNVHMLGSVSLIKYDSSNKDMTLEGAEFMLMMEENGLWVKKGTAATATDGSISFTDLPFGKYKLVETKAPTGYDVATLTFKDGDGTVEINEDNLTIELTAYNTKEKVQGEEDFPSDNPGDDEVLGDEEAPDDIPQKVLGEEAATADSMSILFILMFFALAAIAIIVGIKMRKE